MPKVFKLRDCPACGAARPSPEIRSEPRAEDMTMDQLRPYWSGLFKEKVFFSYDRCRNCGLLFAPTFFTDDQLNDLYSAMAPNMDLVPVTELEATQRGYFETAVAGAPLDGGYLEIGPDVGYIVRHVVADGNFDHLWLVEPNHAVHAQLSGAAGGRQYDIIADMDDLSAVPDGSVSLAMMVHVLDHMLDPVAALHRIRRKLRPDGRVVVVTHDEASLLRTVMRRRWPPFCLQHPQLYNPRSITELIGFAGYGSVKVARSKNYFPLDFLARQAAWTVGLDISKLPLPKFAIGLKLGNMITVALPNSNHDNRT